MSNEKGGWDLLKKVASKKEGVYKPSSPNLSEISGKLKDASHRIKNKME